MADELSMSLGISFPVGGNTFSRNFNGYADKTTNQYSSSVVSVPADPGGLDLVPAGVSPAKRAFVRNLDSVNTVDLYDGDPAGNPAGTLAGSVTPGEFEWRTIPGGKGLWAVAQGSACEVEVIVVGG